MSGTVIDGRAVTVNKAKSAADRAAEGGGDKDKRRDDRDRDQHFNSKPRGANFVGFRINISNLPENFTWRCEATLA